MNGLLQRARLINRVVLGVATLLFLMIGMRNIFNPVGEATPHHIALGSPEAITIMRVTGSVFVALALIFISSIASTRRLLFGTGVLVTVAAVLTIVRLIGLALDGPAPFTLMVLRPEIVITLLSSFAFFLEWTRRRGEAVGA